MPTFEEKQARLKAIADQYRNPGSAQLPQQVESDGVFAPQDQQRPLPSPTAAPTPSAIDYGNIGQGRAAVARIDSPEYKQSEQEVNQLRGMMDLYKNNPDKLAGLNAQMSAKKAALERIRSGK